MSTRSPRDLAELAASLRLPTGDERGLFAVGEASFDGYDPSRHRPATAGRTAPISGGVQ